MKRLQTRLILAGSLLVLATIGASLWSAWTFSRLAEAVDDTLRGSQATVDATTALAGSLEREDDALLLAVSGKIGPARTQLAAERMRGEAQYRQLLSLIMPDEVQEQRLARQLRVELDAYRTAGRELVAASAQPDALKRYHEQVNPKLRQAVGTCGKIREANFQQMEETGIRARDESRKATRIAIAVSVATAVWASVVAVWLARSMLRPLSELTAAVEDLRRGDFDRRVGIASADELGQLAAGFNRMAESIADYRRSSLGELLAAKTALEATLNALPDAVFVVASDGKLTAVNPPGQAVLDAKRVTSATTVHDLPLLREHQEAVTLALAGRRVNGSRTNFANTLPAMLNGRPHKFLVTAAPIPGLQGHCAGAVVVLDDVTEFARLDELRSELIGVASHELKTPLTSLRMNLLLLGEKTDELTDRQKELLTAAVAGCEELGSTVAELLDVTRIEAGQLRLNLASIDLYGVLQKALRPLQPRFDDLRVRVVIDLGSEPAVVRGDPERLGLVFSNLLTNALKYAPPKTTVSLRVMSRQNTVIDSPNILQVAVTDAGPGVPEELRERIFEKFFRVEQHLGQDNSGVHGTGIGLYLCREIVKAHGGTIACEPGDGGIGTRIAIALLRAS